MRRMTADAIMMAAQVGCILHAASYVWWTASAARRREVAEQARERLGPYRRLPDELGDDEVLFRLIVLWERER
jgi:hypothetical protein